MSTPVWFEDLEKYWKETAGPSVGNIQYPRPRDSDLAQPIWGPPPTGVTFPDVDGPESIANPELPYFGIFLRDLSPREQHYVFATKEYWSRKYKAQITRLQSDIRGLKKELARFKLPEKIRAVLAELDPADLREVLRAPPQDDDGCCPDCGEPYEEYDEDGDGLCDCDY